LLGCAFFGAFAVKMLILPKRGLPGWTLPLAGAVVFTVLIGLWFTSAFWFFSTFGLHRCGGSHDRAPRPIVKPSRRTGWRLRRVYRRTGWMRSLRHQQRACGSARHPGRRGLASGWGPVTRRCVIGGHQRARRLGQHG